MAHTPTHTVVGLGGTFDHFHKGHESFLKFAGSIGSRLIIGVTTDKLVAAKETSISIEPYHKRAQAVITFCKTHEIIAEVTPLLDPFGPTITQSSIRGLCVTTATKSGAKAVNDLRSKLGMRDLPVYICQLEKDIHGDIISSTRIRRGEIDRTGYCFIDSFENTIVLNPEQHTFFSKPLGPIVTKPSQTKLDQSPATVIVGDIALQHFRTNRWHYDLGIYDLTSARSAYTAHQDLKPDYELLNSAGSISKESSVLASIFADILDSQSMFNLKVTGEEDLLGVAAILLAPLNTLIYYGQPEEGMVEITVTPQLKWQVATLLNPNLSQI